MEWIDRAEDRDGGRRLSMQQWTIKFHKIWGVSWLTEDLLVSWEGLCSIQGVSTSSSSKEIWNLNHAIITACTSIYCDFYFVTDMSHHKYSEALKSISSCKK